jgi:hypothetical protein
MRKQTKLNRWNSWATSEVNIHLAFDVVLTVHRRYYVEIKCQLDATDEFLLQILLLAQHVSGHHYAHHQELESIIQVVAACRI